MKKINTTVEATIDRKICGTYTISIHEKRGKATLRVTPCEGTGGHWDRCLSTLLLDGPVSNILYLDYGQNWKVHGMVAVYKEIIDGMMS